MLDATFCTFCLYGGEFYNEFVYRQPRSREEVESLVVAAERDPLVGYECDGGSRGRPKLFGPGGASVDGFRSTSGRCLSSGRPATPISTRSKPQKAPATSSPTWSAISRRTCGLRLPPGTWPIAG